MHPLCSFLWFCCCWGGDLYTYTRIYDCILFRKVQFSSAPYHFEVLRNSFKGALEAGRGENRDNIVCSVLLKQWSVELGVKYIYSYLGCRFIKACLNVFVMNRILTVCYVSLLVLVIDDSNFLKTPACGLPPSSVTERRNVLCNVKPKIRKEQKTHQTSEKPQSSPFKQHVHNVLDYLELVQCSKFNSDFLPPTFLFVKISLKIFKTFNFTFNILVFSSFKMVFLNCFFGFPNGCLFFKLGFFQRKLIKILWKILKLICKLKDNS